MEMLKRSRPVAAIVLTLGLLAGCHPKTPDLKTELRGVVDPLGYTSPAGTFSVVLRDFVDWQTVSDHVEDNGSSLRVTFADKQGDQYSVLITYTLNKIPGDFIDNLIKRRKSTDENARKATTPDGTECLLSNTFRRFKDTENIMGEINFVFYRERTIFNVVITSYPTMFSKEAAKSAETAMDQFWARTRFRGRVGDNPDMVSTVDPRIAIVIRAAEKTAAKLNYVVELQRTGKQILRMRLPEPNQAAVLSLGFQIKNKVVTITEAVSSPDKNQAAARKALELFFETYIRECQFQKVYIVRDQSYDETLLVKPH